MVYPQDQAIMKVVDLMLQKCSYQFLKKNRCYVVISKIGYYDYFSLAVINTSSNTWHIIKNAVAIC